MSPFPSLLMEGGMDVIYAGAEGSIDPAIVPTYTRLKTLLTGIADVNGVHVHHGVPKYVMKLLRIPTDKWDDVPSLVMEVTRHQEFHSLLRQAGRIPYGLDLDVLQNSQILASLEDVYTRLGEGDAWKVLKAWLKARGIE